MSASNKILQAAAGNAAADEATYVEDVFSTYLYEGNTTNIGNQHIPNSVNLGPTYSTEYDVVCWLTGAAVSGSSYYNYDVSPYRNTIVPVNAKFDQTSAAQHYRSSSWYFDGTGDRFTSQSNNYSFGTGDFTIEFWMKPAALGVNDFAFQLSNDSAFQSQNNNNQLSIQIYSGDIRFGFDQNWGQGITAYSANTWYHIVFARENSTLRCYIDGVQKVSITDTHDYQTPYLSIGGGFDTNYWFYGWIEDFRLIRGTALYTGASFTPPTTVPDTPTITEDGRGGLVWCKARSASWEHQLWDTERGVSGGFLHAESTAAENANYSEGSIASFTSDGFNIGGTSSTNQINYTGHDFTSWTFAKQEKFFDVVTYTGTGSNQTISHNLGSVPGCIIIKPLGTANWIVYHRAVDATNPQYYYMLLNSTNLRQSANYSYWQYSQHTDADFKVGTSPDVNENGVEHVAYIFAHNDGDGIFGEDGDQDIIKCGSFTSSGQEIDLGFEPQWLLVKATNTTNNWAMFDTMRGFTTGNESNARLRANTSEAEGTNTNYGATSTGFVDNLSNSNTYIYIAIRRGPMKTPESGTEVFAMDEGDATDLGIKTGILTDALILGQRSGSDKYYFGSRLTGTKYLRTNTTAAEATQANQVWDRMDGAWDNNLSSYTGWGFRRAPGFFDVVAYTGNSSTNVISHNLQATPELIIIKKRNASVGWIVWWSTASTNHYLTLDTSNASANFGATWIQDIDSDSFTVLGGYGYNNTNLDDYIAYLFATVPGVSKVGSFSHTNGSTTDVDCGFSSGARFVLIKRTSATGPWALWDSERGIISGTEKYLALDSTAAETDDGGIDYIDPLSSGFQMTGSLSTADYIFLAIA